MLNVKLIKIYFIKKKETKITRNNKKKINKRGQALDIRNPKGEL